MMPRTTRMAVNIPSQVFPLEGERELHQREGNYKSALEQQQKLEQLKTDEEATKIQALQAEHEKAVASLQQLGEEEFDASVAASNAALADLRSNNKAALQALVDRHADEVVTFNEAASQSKPRQRWSSELLNLRTIEEHLIRQREWAKAAKTKAQADAMEARERAAVQEAWQAKTAVEEGKMKQRQAKEVSALKDKHRQAEKEFMLRREKELDMVKRRFAAAMKTLQHQHALERQQLEHALKGWYNPRKVELIPSPLVITEPVSPMSPGHKLAIRREDGYGSRAGSRVGSRVGSPSLSHRASASPSTASSPKRLDRRDAAPSSGGDPGIAASMDFVSAAADLQGLQEA